MKKRIAALWSFAVFAALISGCGTLPTDNNTVSNNNTASEVASEEPVHASATPNVAGAEIKEDDPEKLVAELYKQHDAQKGPFFQKDRSRIDKYFTKELGDLVLRDAIAPEDEIGAFGADPLYDGQDLDLKNFAVGKAVIDGEKATVPVTFVNFGEKKKVTFLLMFVNNTWKISDIKYDHGASLLAILKETYGTVRTNGPPAKNR